MPGASGFSSICEKLLLKLSGSCKTTAPCNLIESSVVVSDVPLYFLSETISAISIVC